MKLNLKYNATKVDEIEKSTGKPIEMAINDTKIGNVTLFIQKGLIDDNGVHGVSKAVAMENIDKYLEESDLDNLVLDITEALVDGGFLSRQLDVEKMRQALKKTKEQVNAQLDKVIASK